MKEGKLLRRIKKELEGKRRRGSLADFISAKWERGRVGVYLKQNVTDFASWDVVGLRDSKNFLKEVHKNYYKTRLIPPSPRLVLGTDEAHLLVEKKLAAFLRQEEAVLFTSKNQAVLTLFSALVREGDLVVFDEKHQSPLFDAAYLVGAETAFFKAKDPLSLEKTLSLHLERSKREEREVFVFAESVSPFYARKINIALIEQICTKTGANLIIDETYALGWYGIRGAGITAESLNERQSLIAIYGDLSLAFCTPFSFVAGSKELVSYLINRSSIFKGESAPQIFNILLLNSALDNVELAVGAREKAASYSKLLWDSAVKEGWASLPQENLPFITVEVEKKKLLFDLKKAFLERGFLIAFANQISAAGEHYYLQIVVSASHKEEQIRRLLSALAEINTHIKEGLIKVS
ncbi:MAG: pyridoxal phosphate-dependent aminotransferase family protein [Candidatus Dadabacteria bacterium]|nr:MAG: pyridoxal phosphate-dependent aminotransferase family protein [Candidatus Dadabacteria bacterium]